MVEAQLHTFDDSQGNRYKIEILDRNSIHLAVFIMVDHCLLWGELPPSYYLIKRYYMVIT